MAPIKVFNRLSHPNPLDVTQVRRNLVAGSYRSTFHVGACRFAYLFDTPVPYSLSHSQPRNTHVPYERWTYKTENGSATPTDYSNPSPPSRGLRGI